MICNYQSNDDELTQDVVVIQFYAKYLSLWNQVSKQWVTLCFAKT